MQLNHQAKIRTHFLTLALAGVLSACGGGGSGDAVSPPADNPIKPPATSTRVDRLGLDVQLFSNTPSNTTAQYLGAAIDSDANITFKNLEQPLPDQPAFNYNFTFPSGLPGGWVQGNFFSIEVGSVKKKINILTPSTTKNVQNVFWRGKDDPTLFGFGLAGYVLNDSLKNWPTSGTATYSGKAFQYIVDSKAAIPNQTTYALYSSDVTASVDYSAKTISIAVAPNPTFIESIGNPAVTQADPNLFAANYVLTNSVVDGVNQLTWDTAPKSGFGLPATLRGLDFFGNKAEELGGYIKYSGDVATQAGPMTRDQFISFALVKQ